MKITPRHITEKRKKKTNNPVIAHAREREREVIRVGGRGEGVKVH